MIKQKIKGEIYTQTKIVNNLNRYLDIATEDEIQAGKVWYLEAQQFCNNMANQYGISLEQAAGITSVMSSQTSWTVNKMFTRDFLKTKGKAKVTTLERVLKARKILIASPGDSIMEMLSTQGEQGAKKTKAFFDSILHPEDTHLVVIDRHQIAASIQRPDSTMALAEGMGTITALQYDFLSECVRQVANRAEMGFSFSQIQSVIWIVYRRCRGLFEHKPNQYNLPGYMEVNPF